MNKTFKIGLSALMIAGSIALVCGLVFAQSPTTPTACLGAVVATREASLDAAASAYAQSLNTAYTNRAAALAAAYAGSDNDKTIHAAIRSAWSAFTASMKAARIDWRTSRNDAWSTFNSSAKSCKVVQSISDADHSIQEVSGN